MAKTDPQMRIRLPEDCKAFVAEQAQRDACSQNSIIVRAIRTVMLEKIDRPTASTVDRPDTKSTNPSKDHEHGKCHP